MVRIACPCGQLLETQLCGAMTRCPRCGAAVGVPRVGLLAAGKVPALAGVQQSLSTPPADRPRRVAISLLVLGLLLMAGTVAFRFLPEWPRPSPGDDAQMSSTVPDLPGSRTASEIAEPVEVVDPAEAVYLGWRPDRPFRQEWSCQTQQRFKSPAQNGEVAYRSRFVSAWKPFPWPLAHRHLEQKVERAQLNMKNGFQSLNFDSAGDDRTSEVAELLRSARLSFDIKPDGQVARVDGADALLDDIDEAAPELLPVFEPCLNADAQKHLAEGLFSVLPEQTLKPGESWVRQKRLPPMLGGRLAGEHRYTFEGRDGRLVRIQVRAELVFQPDQPTDSAKAPMTILKGRVTGTIWFDPVQGRIARSETERHIDGKAALPGEDGATVLVEITNVQKAQMRIDDGPS